MKPDFTLSLSQDGIRLLRRAATGWDTVGQADPAAPTLSDDLAALRQAARALDPSGDVCALAIPDTQIRYLTLTDTDGDDATRRDAARIALEGATPYAVSELVFDISADGDVTHVAAVARETLAEAETFARNHQFNPTHFVGHAQAEGFTAEPFFGLAQSAAAPPADTVPEEDTADAGADPNPTFVSRRQVPTFRTEAPAPEPKELAGFSEHPASFTPVSKPPRPKRPVQSALPAPGPVVRKPKSEVERFTVFGARASNGLSGRMGAMGVGIILCVVLIAGLAAFAGGAIGTSITDLYTRLTQPQPEAQFTSPLAPEPSPPVVQAAISPADPAPEQSVAAQPVPDLTDEDAAVLDALRVPDDAPTPSDPALEPAVEPILRAPAITGIWAEAPGVPSPPPLIDLEDLYVTSIDPINPNFDAVALPALASKDHDAGYPAPPAPAPAGTKFTLDARGMVVPTPAGAMNADGILVFAGPPPARPPLNLVKTEDPDVDLADRLVLAGLRPRLRPDDLAETTERATLTGLTRSELGQIRPRLRPQSDQELARASASSASLVQLDGTNSRSLLQQPDGAGSAVVASLRPDPRPGNFSETVAKARASAPVPAPAPAPTPRTVTPKIPSSASATREATTKNAINLRQVNLIGVYGKPSSRRALVRLGNGSYRKVEVGDNIDGGKVSAIGDAELRYQKSGRAIVLKMPRS